MGPCTGKFCVYVPLSIPLDSQGVRIARRNQTQNQGFSKVVVVYSGVMVRSQRINLCKAERAAREWSNNQGSVTINQSKYKRAQANLKV